MDYYYKVADLIKQKNYDIECSDGRHWGICRAREMTCDELDLNLNLTFTITDTAHSRPDHGHKQHPKYEFTIPLENIAVNVNQSGTSYCQTQIALLPNAQNAVILGSAFYTAFVGMFDTENDRIGFANSMRALPGSSIVCHGSSCETDHTKDGPQTE